jgi:DNA-binding IclR family transcriptional regulator
MGKVFEVLDLFSLACPLLRIEDISARLGYTRSTAYRYVRELCDAGLLTPISSSGAYALGPRIIELERLLELTDPLYRAGQSVLPEAGGPDTVLLLHNLYRDKVLCIYKQGPDMLEHAGRRIQVRRARGLPFPLFQGAASLALLAFLSTHRIRQTYLRSAAQIDAAGLGSDWNAFRDHMGFIRRQGFAISRGQITPFLAGVAVPILDEDRRLIGSLARAFASDTIDDEVAGQWAVGLTEIAGLIAREYARISQLPAG